MSKKTAMVGFLLKPFQLLQRTLINNFSFLVKTSVFPFKKAALE